MYQLEQIRLSAALSVLLQIQKNEKPFDGNSCK